MDYADRFSAGEGIYLLSHSVGRPPRDVQTEVATTFFKPWEGDEGEPWPQWLQVIDQFRAALARLFHSSAEHFCPQTNLSSALSKVVAALPPRASRNVLLLSEDDFPSMGFVLQQAERLGYVTRFIPASEPVNDLQVWSRHLTGDTAIALLTHVQSNTSRMLPVDEVARLAREREVVTIVDVAQSVGVIPIDIAAWNADFVIGSCVKWLCGGPGAAFLWVNPSIVDECAPLDVGWFSHADPFALRIREFRYHPGALRFWGGTPSILPAAVATVGIRTLTDIGIETVRRHNLELSQKLIDTVDETVLRSPRHPAERGGTVVLHFGALHSAVVEQFRAAAVRFDTRSFGARLSPHIYNSDRELNIVLGLLNV